MIDWCRSQGVCAAYEIVCESPCSSTFDAFFDITIRPSSVVNSPRSAISNDVLPEPVGPRLAPEAIADAAIDQVARWSGHGDLAQRIVVRRTVGPADFSEDLGAWRGSMLGPAHTLGQSAMFRAGNRSRKVDGLYCAGSSTIPGIGLPMCLISAEIVADRIARELP